MRNTFELQNSHVEGFYKWLSGLQLTGKQSRERSRLVTILVNHWNANIETKRVELISKYANKDEEGNPAVIIDSKARKIYDVPPEKSQVMNDEFAKVLAQNLVIAINDGNKDRFNALSDLVLNTEYIFGPNDGDAEPARSIKIKLANDYVVWSESFENLALE